ncbi:unnamed protein product [Rhizophagus irregularis]|nr:unnamed protein product [Rhizophagus irregularis]
MINVSFSFLFLGQRVGLPSSEERKTKIRKDKYESWFWAGFLVPKNGKEPRFISGRLPKIGRRGTKIRFRVPKNGKKRTKIRSGGLRTNEGIMIRLGGLWTNGRTKIRSWASKERRMEKPKDSFGWASKERKTQRFVRYPTVPSALDF